MRRFRKIEIRLRVRVVDAIASRLGVIEYHSPQIEWRMIARINRRLIIDAATDLSYTDDSSNVPALRRIPMANRCAVSDHALIRRESVSAGVIR